MKTYLLLAGLGAAGVFLRFFISVRFADFGWPWGTLLVNVVGCLFIGLLYSWMSSGQIHQQTYTVFTVGLLGALTTFSSFSLDTLKLIEGGRFLGVLAYVGLNNLMGLLACYLGTKLGTILHIS